MIIASNQGSTTKAHIKDNIIFNWSLELGDRHHRQVLSLHPAAHVTQQHLRVQAVQRPRSVFSLSIANIKKTQFSPYVTCPDKRLGSQSLVALIMTLFGNSRWIEPQSDLKCSLFMGLGQMDRPRMCSAAAVMENTVSSEFIPWLTCEIPAFFKPLFFTSTTCPLGVYTMFFFHAVKSCVKNLCRNSRAITYRNLFFCLMIRILKIWAVSGWWHADCFSAFVPFLSWIWGEDKDETLMPKFSAFLGSDTRQTYRLIACCFLFLF